jgi:hypothetical protein
VRELLDGGVEIELHTHRHWSPGDEALGVRELRRQRGGDRAHHRARGAPPLLPVGALRPVARGVARRGGVRSGTTCVPGFVDARTPRYRLGRFLDGENIDQLEFEAELAGVLELRAACAHRLKGPRAVVVRRRSGGGPSARGADVGNGLTSRRAAARLSRRTAGVPPPPPARRRARCRATRCLRHRW